MPPRKPKPRQPRSTDHLVTTFPKPVRCGRCGETVLHGDFAGIRTKYDITPLSPVGELEAVKLGLKTFYMIIHCQYFGERTAWLIRKELRPDMNGVVVREHRCGTPRSKYTEPPRTLARKDEEVCPF